MRPGQKSQRRLWFDDRRKPPGAEWQWAQTVGEAIDVLETAQVDEASLDGHIEVGPDPRSGLDLCAWMTRSNRWPRRALTVHSSDPVLAERMIELIARDGPYTWHRGRRFLREPSP